RAYHLLTDNAGNHTLDVLVHEKMADGIRTYTAATYPLTVLPANQGNTITVQQISDMIYVYETVDPLNTNMFMQLKAEAPSGIESIKWLNPPMICGSSQLVDYTMQSKDRTYFTLAGSSAYRAMLAEKMQQVALQVNTHNGLSFKTDLSLNIHKDPAAFVAIDPDIAELSIIGETSKAIAINITDSGKNVMAIAAYAFPQGFEIPSTCVNLYDSFYITQKAYLLSQYITGQILPVFDSQRWLINSWPMADQSMVFRLPISANIEIATGTYDLRIITYESDGKISISKALPIHVLDNK
ncbi:hypothetical protein MHK_001034, partial [Candidatus Magnetomorum sp. HK-1]